jgi:diguanylate cyclase (GGDEF)-like protein/PAS domain S-box-containing protein
MTDHFYPQEPAVVTTHRMASDGVLASLQLRKRALEASHHGIFIMDVTSPDKSIVSVNQSFCQLTGYQREQVLGKPFSILLGYEQHQVDLQGVLFAITENNEQKVELRCYQRSGELFWAEVDFAPIPNADGKTTHFIGILHDITLRRGMEEQLIQQATHDALTKLPNRSLLIDRFRQALIRARKRKELMGLLFVDLDRFKFINDTYGHNVGDHVLYLVAQRLVNHTRDNDTVARIGGDEFIILLPTLRSIRDGELIAESILHSISQPYAFDHKQLILTASVGISFFPRDGDDFDLLLKQADAAMYRAKEEGRNTLRTFTHEHSERILQRVKIEKECREAVKNQEFELHYQPIFHMLSGDILAVEALLRDYRTRGVGARNGLSKSEIIT